MKRITLLLLVGFVMLYSYAQKVDLDREYIKVKYTNLPTEPILDESFRTYAVTSNKGSVASKIKIYGFEKLGTEATVNVDINIGNVIVEGVEINKREKVNKDKEGNVVSLDGAKYHFVKVLFKADKLSLYKYKKELVLKKADDKKGQSTSSLAYTIGFKKKLAKLVIDCPSLAELAKEGLFSNTEESLLAFVQEYADGCK